MRLNSKAKFHRYFCSIVKRMLHVIFVVVSVSVTSFGQESLKVSKCSGAAHSRGIPQALSVVLCLSFLQQATVLSGRGNG